MDELKKILLESVPLVGSIIGTASPVAGFLFNSIAHLFGLPITATPDQIATAIQNDPDHDIKLRSLEIQHQDALMEAATQIRMGAYDREKAIVASTGKRDWVMDFLAVFIVVAFFTLAIIAFTLHLDPEKQNLCYFLLGVFGSGGFSVVVGYYFGNSLIQKINSPKGEMNIIKNQSLFDLPPPPAVTGKG